MRGCASSSPISLGAPVSLGTLVRWVRQGAETLRPVEEAIKGALTRAPVLHSDETGVRRAGSAGVGACGEHEPAHPLRHPRQARQRGDRRHRHPARAITGVSVHDGWKPYRHYTACRHALCNIHHLRELTFLEEAYDQAWAKELKALLLEMKTAVEAARTRGEDRVGDAERSAFLTRYEALLGGRAGRQSTAGATPRQRGRVKQSPARNLLERLWLRQDEVLAFLDDFTIPFDNNQAEQDLRMLKVQQKIAGSFRADSGSEAFARIRGYLSSMRKQGVALLAALQTVFTGQPLYPALD